MGDRNVVLITGANTGLGFQTVKALSDSDIAYELFMGARSLGKAEQAIKTLKRSSNSTKSNVWPIIVDIEDDASIQKAFTQIQNQFGRLDILINNAGAQFDPQYHRGEMTMREAWNASWNLNTAGTQIMTATFIPLLLKSPNPRLLFIASGTSSLTTTENIQAPINKVPASGWPKTGLNLQSNIPAYRSAKCGMNMMMREWHRMLQEDGVKVWCISPGFLATGLGGDTNASKSLGAGDPALAGQFIKSVIEGGRDNDVGLVINKDGVQPW